METEILGVAARIFSERGYQGTTLDDIAAANISRSTFSSYFASKEALLHRIYHEVIATTQAAVFRLGGEDRPAPEKLRRAACRIRRMSGTTPLISAVIATS